MEWSAILRGHEIRQANAQKPCQDREIAVRDISPGL
jgi:hypothetical protein